MMQRRQKSKILKIAESLALEPNSSGIIDNTTNDVLFRNPSSYRLFEQWRRQFKIEVLNNTSTTHNTSETIARVIKLKELSLPLHQCQNFFEKRYTIHFEGIGDILAVDRFYLLKYGRRYGCRVWVNQSWSYAYIKPGLQLG